MGKTIPDKIGYVAKRVRHPILRWIVLAGVTIALAAAMVVGVHVLAAEQQWDVPAGSATVNPSVFQVASPATSSPDSLPAPDPAPGCLAAALGAVPRTGGGTLTGQVIGLQSGDVLWDSGASQPMIPASSEKLLTVMALINTLGPDALATTYQTSVVADGAKIVLVGGGDPYLASDASTATLGQRQTMADLAAATAQALQADGRTSVSLGFDDTAFSGPDWHPTWDPKYATAVTHVSALWVDAGMTPSPATTPEARAVRSVTPAYDAATLFATQLRAHGIQVTGVDTTGAAAPAGQPPLASIDSLPLGAIISDTLLASDNSAAEVLFRHLAIATGRPGSFDAGAAAVNQWLNDTDLAEPGMQIVDGSGLSRQDMSTAAILAGTIAWADKQGGAPREIIAGLGVAAYSGTLGDRFNSPAATRGRGFIHAKTGSLDGVSSLTGYAVTDQGQQLAFSVIVNGVSDYNSMRAWLDQVAAAMVVSGC